MKNTPPEDNNFWSKLMGSDEAAASYMDTYGEGPGFATRDIVMSHLKPGWFVLDAGCGPGWNFDHFQDNKFDVTYRGEDYSERFVRVASHRAMDKYGWVNVFSKGDIRNLAHLDSTFDAVILQDCLEHTNGYEKPVNEALRVARKRVIVSFWHLTEDDDHINDDGDDGYGAWYSQPKWEAFLDTLPYQWHDEVLQVPGKTHKWNFYIINKEEVK